MSLSDIAKQVGRSQGDGSGSKVSDDDLMDIIEFVESPYGLGFAKELCGKGLYPVQKFILKMFYNITLEDEEEVIRVPRSWRDVGSSAAGSHFEFTEEEYLEYLYSNGRCNIKKQDRDRKELVLPLGRRGGKCVHKDTLIFTENGVVPIKSLGDLDGPEKQSLNTTVVQEDKTTAQTNAFYNPGVEDTKIVTTSCGFRIEGTHNHRIRVMSQKGTIEWRRLDEIEKGDSVCIPKGSNLWSTKYVDLTSYHNDRGRKEFDFPEKLNEDWGLLLGILCGDGTWCIDNRTDVTVGNYPEMKQTVEDLFETLLGGFSVYEKSGGNCRVVYNGVSLRQFLHDIGWTRYPEPDEKRVPWSVLQSPRSVVVQFLRGLFETDGGVEGGRKVTFSSASERMVRDVQNLLLNFGIVSSVRPKQVNGKTYWRLSVFGYESRKLFSNEIGFITDRKQKSLERGLKIDGTGSSRLQSVPNQLVLLEELIESVPKHNPLVRDGEKGWNRMNIRSACGNVVKPSGCDGLTYSRIERIVEAADGCGADNELISHFKSLKQLNLFYDPVESVEDSSSVVCDVSVPEGHQFVAGGFVNHNSFMSSVIASYETYKLIKRYNPQAYYGVPDGTQVQVCSIATSKDQAGMLYKEIRRLINSCDFLKKWMERETQTMAEFHTPYDLDVDNKPSIRTTFYSSSAKGVRGSANIVAIMDEVAFFKTSGQSSAKEVYQALSPSLAQFSPKDPNDASKPIGDSDGRMIMISSPYAKEGLFFKKYATALSGSKAAKDTLLIQAPTWEVNPTIPFDYLEKEYEKDPTVFRTEFGAEFTEKTTSWIERDDDLMQCVNPGLVPKSKGKPRDRHFMGFDLAPKGDRTSLVLTRLQGDRIQLAYHEEWQAGTDWYELNPHLDKPILDYAKGLASTEVLDYEKIADWMEGICSRFFVVDGVYDSYEGIGFNQILQKRGLSKKIEMENFSSRLDSQMYKAFKMLMYNQQFEMYDYVTTDDNDSGQRKDKAPYIQELLELQGTKRGKKIEVVEAPQVQGKHDDFSDALVRSIWLAQERLVNRKSTSQKYTGGTGGGVGGRNQKMPRSRQQYQRKRRRRHNYSSKRRQ